MDQGCGVVAPLFAVSVAYVCLCPLLLMCVHVLCCLCVFVSVVAYVCLCPLLLPCVHVLCCICVFVSVVASVCSCPLLLTVPMFNVASMCDRVCGQPLKWSAAALCYTHICTQTHTHCLFRSHTMFNVASMCDRVFGQPLE